MSDPASSQQINLHLDWKNATGARGVPHAARAPFTHARREPCAELAPFIEHYWHVNWDLPEGVEHTQATLPHPSVHLVHEDGSWRLYGVQTARFARTLRGREQVLGVKFRPGMFRGFLAQDVAALTDRVEEQAVVFDGLPDRASVGLASLEAALLARKPALDPPASKARDLVALIAADPSLLRAEQVSEAADLSRKSHTSRCIGL